VQGAELSKKSTIHLSRKTLAHLFHKEVVDFEFPCYPSKEAAENFDQANNPLWKKLMLDCPRLEKIVLDGYEEYIDDSALFLDKLMSMKHLQVVELIQLWFDDSNLYTVAENLPNLR
jgi:hypothetical protein